MNQSIVMSKFKESEQSRPVLFTNTTPAVTNSVAMSNEGLFKEIILAIRFYVIPCVSVLGVSGNITSIVVLVREGLRKSSNILLFSLALADISLLVGINSAPHHLYIYIGNYAFKYSYEVSLLLVVSYCILRWIYFAGVYVSLSLPVFITLERLIAIFLPFKFNTIVTRARTWGVVITVFLVHATIITYQMILYQFAYLINAHNVSSGHIVGSSLMKSQEDIAAAVYTVHNHLTGTVPVILVILGSIVIGIKIKMATAARKKLTSKKDASTSRTTKTLLSVCVFYSVITGIVCINDQITPNVQKSDLNGLLRVIDFPLLCINSSCNYLIYVATNPKFRIFRRNICRKEKA